MQSWLYQLQLFYIYCSKIYFSLSHSLAHLSYNANVIIINMSAQAYQPPLLSLIIICSHYNWCFTFVSNYPLIIISDRHTHAQVVVNCQLLRVQGHFSFFHPFRWGSQKCAPPLPFFSIFNLTLFLLFSSANQLLSKIFSIKSMSINLHCLSSSFVSDLSSRIAKLTSVCGVVWCGDASITGLHFLLIIVVIISVALVAQSITYHLSLFGRSL